MSKRAAMIWCLLAAGSVGAWQADAAQRGGRTVRSDVAVRQNGVARISGVVITRDEPPRPVRVRPCGRAMPPAASWAR